jgi:hypothetical protein
MALTRIKNNQHTDANAAESNSTLYSAANIALAQLAGIHGSTKLVNYSVTGDKWANAITAVSDVRLMKANTGSSEIGGNLLVEGNLTVIGSVTSVEATTTRISDSVIQLGYGNDNNGINANADIGIIFTLPNDNAALIYDQTAAEFQLGYTSDDAYTANTAIDLNPYGNLRVEKLSANLFNIGNLIFANSTITTDGTEVNVYIRANSATGNIELLSNNTIIANTDVIIGTGLDNAGLTVVQGDITASNGQVVVAGNLIQSGGNVNINATFGTFTLGTGEITLTSGGNIRNLQGNIDSNVSNTNTAIVNVNSYVVSTGIFGSNTDVVANANGAFSAFDYVTAIDPLAGNTFAGNGHYTGNVYVNDTLFTTNLRILGDLVVPGNLRVEGNTTILNVETLASEDPIIRLNANTDVNANVVIADGVDVGLQFSTNIAGNITERFLGVLDTDYSTLVFYSNASITGAAVTGNELGGFNARDLQITGAFANGDPANSSIGANVTIGSNANVGGNAIVGTNLYVGGFANIMSDAEVGHDLAVGGNIAYVSGLQAPLTDAGNLYVANTACIFGNLSVGKEGLGPIGYGHFFSNAISTSSNTGAVVIHGGIGIMGNINADGEFNNIGNIQISGNIITNNKQGQDVIINPNANGNIVINDTLSTGNIIINGAQANLVVISGRQAAIAADPTLAANFAFTTGVDFDVKGNSAVRVSYGNNAQRPVDYTSSNAAKAEYLGAIRFNTESTALEWWDGYFWNPTEPNFSVVTSVTISGSDLDQITGNFSLPNAAVNADSIGSIVAVNGVLQIPGVAYTITPGVEDEATGTVTTPAVITFDNTDLPASTDRIDIRAFTTTQRRAVTSLTAGGSSVDVSNGSTVSVTGDIIPSANVTYNLGSASRRWNEIFLAGGTINMGTIKLKDNGGGLRLTDEADVTLLDVGANKVTVTNIEKSGGNGTGNIGNSTSYFGGIYVESVNAININATVANLSSVNKTGTSGTGDIGNSTAKFGTVFSTSVNIESVVKSGTSGSGDIGSSTNIFGTVYATTANVSAVVKSGTSGSGDIGSSTNIFGTVYATTANVSNIVKSGTSGSGDIGSSTNIFGTVYATTANVSTVNATTANVSTVNATTANVSTVNATTANVSNIVKSGTSGTGDIGSSTNIFGTIYATTANVSDIAKSGTSGTGNIGSSTNTFNTVFARATSAQYADLAECYSSDQNYEPGTVVVFGGDAEVTLATADMSQQVAGIVSTNPAYLMNDGLQGTRVAVALQGRVPSRVLGSVKKGDMMVSAGNGRARAERYPVIGSVIGKALQDFDGVEGVIEIVVGRT